MSEFELANVRAELQAAIEALKDEPTGEQAGQTRERDRAADHIQTAMHLLQGSSSERLMGHPSKSEHEDLTVRRHAAEPGQPWTKPTP